MDDGLNDMTARAAVCLENGRLVFPKKRGSELPAAVEVRPVFFIISAALQICTRNSQADMRRRLRASVALPDAICFRPRHLALGLCYRYRPCRLDLLEEGDTQGLDYLQV